MGKFGSFQLSELVGKPYGLTFEILTEEKIRIIKRDELINIDDSNEPEENNNQNIIDTQDAQVLTPAQIHSLKEKMTGEELAEYISKHNKSFELKTQFSKDKYMKRKKQKFSRSFTAIQPTPRTLCEFYFEKHPEKIMCLRMDALSLLLNMTNVKQGSKLLVVDETQGLILGSILSRMKGDGQVLAISESDQTFYDNIRYLNMPESHTSIMKQLPWNRISAHPDEKLDEEASKIQQAVQRVESVLERRKILEAGNFDGLIIASTYHPLSILKKLMNYLSKSRPIAIYSPYMEPLLETFHQLRTGLLSRFFVNVELSNQWTRQYQVLKNRTRPLNNMPSSSGYLLFATFVDSKSKQSI